MELQKKATCSFCSSTNTECVRSNLSAKAICMECLYACKEMTSEFPPGAIYCFKCFSIAGFSTIYTGGSVVEWVFGGLDSTEVTIYTIKSVSRGFGAGMSPIKCVCSSCDRGMELWILDKSKYVQQAHSS